MSGELTNVMRMVLMGRETYRVTQSHRGLRVRSGRAWITLNGRDHVLKRGEEIALQTKGDYAVVSSAGRTPVVIELLSEAPRQSDANLRPVVKAL
jgi:hypothetical protein